MRAQKQTIDILVADYRRIISASERQLAGSFAALQRIKRMLA